MVVPGNAPWVVNWLQPWGGPLLLDGLTAPGFRGDMGLGAYAESHAPMSGTMEPAQPWSVGFRAGSVSVTFTRAGGVGSLISFEVRDRGNPSPIGSLAGVNYPSGQTTVVIPVTAGNYDLAKIAIINLSYPTSIDLTVNDITASPIVIPRVWTNYVKSQESV